MIDSDIGHVVQNMEKIAVSQTPFAGGIPGGYMRVGQFGTSISDTDEEVQDKYSHDDKVNPVGEKGGGLKKFGTTYVPRADVYRGPAHGHITDGVCFTDDPASQQQVPIPSPFQHLKNSRNSSGYQKTAADDSKPGTAGVDERGADGSGAVSGTFRSRLKPRVKRKKLRTVRRLGPSTQQETAPMKQVLQPPVAITPQPQGQPVSADPAAVLAALSATPEGRAMMAAYAGAVAAPPEQAPEPVEAPVAPAAPAPQPAQMKTAEKLEVLPPRQVDREQPTLGPPKLASDIQVEFDVQGMGKLRFKVHDIQVESEIVVISQDPENSFSPPSGSYLNLTILDGPDVKSPDKRTFQNLGFPGIEFQPKGMGLLYQVYLITPPAAAE
jgi:hypothetical protein